jgi:cytochrome c553
MSIFLIKSIIGIFFLLAGLIALLSMLSLMGRAQKKMSPQALRKIHRSAGIAFTFLLLLLSYLCLKYMVRPGNPLSTRAVFHGILSLFLIVILFLKIAIVQFYKQFLKYVPGLGMIVFSLAFVVFFSSAGYYFLRSNPSSPAPARVTSGAFQPAVQGNAEKGSRIFARMCAVCHYADREDTKTGPGLKGILKRELLPASKRPANEDNIRRQLKSPMVSMPAFDYLTEADLAHLLAYLRTL